MKNRLRILALILIAAMLLGCSVSFADGEGTADTGTEAGQTEEETEATDAGDAADAEKKSSTAVILFTGDMHSHLEQLPLIRTAYKQKKEGSGSVFLVDAGDFSMGTPFQTIFTTHAAELRTMGAAGYDVTTLGSSEFRFGTAGLAAMLGKAAKDDKIVLPELVISNVVWAAPQEGEAESDAAAHFRSALEEYGAAEYTVIRRGGVSAAFFGILSGGAGAEAAGAPSFGDAATAAGRTAAFIGENEETDLVICLLQSSTGDGGESLAEAENIAKRVTGIDLIICGGAETLEEPEVINGTKIVSGGKNADYLGLIEISLNGDAAGEVYNYRLIPLVEKGAAEDADASEEDAEAEKADASEEEAEAEADAEAENAADGQTAGLEVFGADGFEPDKAVYDKVVGFKAAVDKDFFSYYGYGWDKVLANNNIPFTSSDDFGSEHGEDTLGNLLTDAMVYAVKSAEGADRVPVDVAMISSDLVSNSIGIGDITTGDVFEALPLGSGKDGRSGYPIISFYITGEELKYLAEADVTTLRNKALPRFYFAGLEYKWNPHRIVLDRAYQAELRNEEGELVEIEDNKLYRVISDPYSAGLLSGISANTRGLLKVIPRDEKGQPIEDLGEYIINTRYGDELKEWYALASYIDSFENEKVPEYYRVLQGRKELVDSRSPIAILRNPNRFFFVVTAIMILAILLIYVIVRLIVRTVIKRRLARAGAEGAETPDALAASGAAAAAEGVSGTEKALPEESKAPDESKAPEEGAAPEEEPEPGDESAEAVGASEEAEGAAEEAPETEEEGAEETEPAKPLWSEIFTPVEFNWDTDAEREAGISEEETDGPMAAVPEWSSEYDSKGTDEQAEEPLGPMTPFGPAPGRSDEQESEFDSVKSLFADMGDLGSDVIGAVAPNVEPEEPVFEHLDFDWSQEVPEPEPVYETAPEDAIKSGEKVFDRAVKIDDEKELAALLSAEELLDQKVSSLKANKKTGKKEKKKYHISDKRKNRK